MKKQSYYSTFYTLLTSFVSLIQSVENEHIYTSIDAGRDNERKAMDPLLSEYSEFYDNDKSDISDLFEKHPRGSLRGQRTLSDECGSIRSLSMDMDDVVPLAINPIVAKTIKGKSLDEDDETYASSSCSISIESEGDILRGHQITVPVTIEAPPPEHRVTLRKEISDPKQNLMVKKAHSVDAADEIRRVSVTGPGPSASTIGSCDVMDTRMPSALEPGMRMVLVRDIGVQVCGDSPNLNLTRRAHKKHQQQQQSQHQQAVQQHGSHKKDSLAEQFPAEILF